MFGNSVNQIIREAHKEIATRQLALRAPRVLWAGLTESPENFAMRCAALQLQGADRILAAVPFGFPVPGSVKAVEFGRKMYELLYPTYVRYRAGSGGRGSGRSHAFATALILHALSRRIRILCCREFQNSIRESVHQLLSSKVEELGVSDCFELREREIECTATGSDIIFAGLHQNASALKSLEDIGICYVEEADTVSKVSLEALRPTIRAKNSELWFSWNPSDSEAPVEEFRSGRSDTRHVHMTHADNPFLPDVLEAERLIDSQGDDDDYRHVWQGEFRVVSDAQVFRGKFTVQDFEPDVSKKPGRDWRLDVLASQGRHEEIQEILRVERESSWQGPYYGVDWGFSQDPSTMVRAWIFGRRLYIDHEAWGLRVDTDRLPTLFDAVPDARKHTIRSDSARPETISALQQNGYPHMRAVDKWKGSVEDGVAFIRSFEQVIIHPRCEKTLEEFRLYSYRVDRLTGDILPDLVDDHNHLIDALRYALQPAIQQRRAATITRLRL